MRRTGRILFILMWIPFTCVFLGMAELMGAWGRGLAVFFPTLFEINESGGSLLTTISFVATFTFMLTAMALTFGAPLMASILNRRILRNGELAPARILALQQTGTYVNNNPEVRFHLEVHPMSGSPFQAEADKIVSLVDLGRFREEATIAVRFDPISFETAISEEKIPFPSRPEH